MTSPLFAQSCGSNPPTEPARFAWQQGLAVTVNISPAFSVDQEAAIEAALNNWMNSLAGQAAGVTFTGFTRSGTPTTGIDSAGNLAPNIPGNYQISLQTPMSGAEFQASTAGGANSTSRTSAWTQLNPGITDILALTQAMAHEIGHTYGLDECDACAAMSSVMTQNADNNLNDTTTGEVGPTDIDIAATDCVGSYVSGCTGSGAACEIDEDCSEGESCGDGCCVGSGGQTGGGDDGGGDDGGGGDCGDEDCEDPIIIDLSGNGYLLTTVAGGVRFSFSGSPVQMSWTAAGWEGGFPALDRNGNGLIDSGAELFGNVTPQPVPATGKPNGFLALAVYDQPANGGNGDRWITEADAVYSKLLIWVDKNHNGISEPGELLSLKQVGVTGISLSYALSKWTDAFGNVFRYRSQMRTTSSPDQSVYDVLLQVARPNKATAAATKAGKK